MRKISLDNAKAGMVLARKIDDGGKALFSAGTMLDEAAIAQLRKLQINTVYVKNKNLDDIRVMDIISEDTRDKAIADMREIFNLLRFNDSVDIFKLDRTVDKIVKEVLRNRNALVNLTDVRSFDAYIYAHSVNVAMLSILTGIFLGYNHKHLQILGLGALLHDLGKLSVSKKILYKPGALTEKEYAEIKKHTEIGYQILKSKKELPLPVPEIAYQHHERLDGSGYPLGLKGHEMHEFSKIVAITNVFDALLADRPYRKAYLPHEAAEIISSQNLFDPHIARVFLENIAIYPMGSIVELNTGEIGVVIDVNKGKQTKPIIRLFCDRQRQKIKDFREIDLSKDNNTYIIRVHKDDSQVCQYLD